METTRSTQLFRTCFPICDLKGESENKGGGATVHSQLLGLHETALVRRRTHGFQSATSAASIPEFPTTVPS